MSAYLWIIPIVGLLLLVYFLLSALQRWTATKQEQLSAEEFRLWFQTNYLGAKGDSRVQPGSGESATRSRKAAAVSSQTKPASSQPSKK